MDYIYFFINSSFSDYVLIGESDDYAKTLETINGLGISPTPFEAYLVYKKPEALFSIDLFFHAYSTGQTLTIIGARYYKIKKEDAYSFLHDIAENYHNVNDLILINSSTPSFGKESEAPRNEGIVSKTINAPKSHKSVLGKNQILEIVKNSGLPIHEKYSVFSLNKNGKCYWMTPSAHCLDNDWTLILDDYRLKKIYVFDIPAKSFFPYQFTLRNDDYHKNVLSININYNDLNFKDTKGHVMFAPYLIGVLDYPDGIVSTTEEISPFHVSDNKTYNNIAASNAAENKKNINVYSKEDFVRLIEKAGYSLFPLVTYASLLEKEKDFWIASSPNCLNEDWTIILNDNQSNRVFLFNVGANSIQPSQVRIRRDISNHSDRLDIRIIYNPDFLERKNNISFGQFLVAAFDYADDKFVSVNLDDLLNDNLFWEDKSTSIKVDLKVLFISLIKKSGYFVGDKVSFSSLIANKKYYWIAPYSDCLNEDWTIILDDNNKEKVYLFRIEANAIPKSSFKVIKKDARESLDIKIIYSSSDFSIENSDVTLRPFLIASFDYTDIATSEEIETIRNTKKPKHVSKKHKNKRKQKSLKEYALPDKGSKKTFVDYLIKNGCTVYPRSSLSSLNKNGRYYWSNPPIDCINFDWSLILNDNKLHKLHLFNIPANSINKSDLVIRNDDIRHDVFNIMIYYAEGIFIDQSSGYNFKKYLVATLDYSNDLLEQGDSINASSNIVHHSNLDSHYEHFNDMKPLSLIFLGQSHIVNSWSDVVDIIINKLYEYNPSQLRKLAHEKGYGDFLCINGRKSNGERADDRYKEIENSGIFYCSKIDDSPDSNIRLLKKCISKFDFTGDDFQVNYR